GTAEVILSYFFPPEADRLKKLAEECSISRLYGGVHFVEDLDEGLRLGRQIGRIVTEQLTKQNDMNQSKIDIPINIGRNANLPPPPYEQIITFPARVRSCNLPLIP
ncbi:MAG: chloroperoxidase, partial [Clostridia bacterium]|nr:chloroperoxidase [Clostridia bacterium]